MSDLPDLPILSIRQPWAWAILSLGKDIENRTWSTRIRGRVLVHAGKAYDEDDLFTVRDTYARAGGDVAITGAHALPCGGIVGSVEIVDCVETSASPWFFGPFGFVLRNPERMELVPMSGRLGFFRASDARSIRPSTASRQTDLFGG